MYPVQPPDPERLPVYAFQPPPQGPQPPQGRKSLLRRFPWWVYALVLLCVCGGIASIFNPPKSTTPTNNSAIVVAAPTATVAPTTEAPQVQATIVIEAGDPAQAVLPDVKVLATQPAAPSEPATIVLEPTEPMLALTAGKVTRVVDGDTLDIDIGGTVSRVRIIGVDTPETVDPRQPVMCYGKEASAETKRLVDLASKNVQLEKDVSETDRYGRLLRYVWLEHPDGRRMLNLELVKGGFAQVATYPPDVKYEQYLRGLEQEARSAGRGLWGPACKGSAIVQPASRPTATPASQPAPPPAGNSKVIISNVYFDGQEYRSEGDEYAVVKNTGSVPSNLEGYRLNAGDPGQDFVFPSFVLKPGQEVRVYTNRDIPGSFSFNYGRAIWNNQGDCGHLYDPNGNEVTKYCY